MKNLIYIATVLLFISCGHDSMSDQRLQTTQASTSSQTQQAEREAPTCICTMQYDPVCANGKTYSNECSAKCEDVKSYIKGACSSN